MPEIHPTAILEGDINLADDVEIGPGCVLTGPITIGPGSRLIGHVWLNGPLTLGKSNTLYPNACLGFAPQDISWDPKRAGAGVMVGRNNLFREGVTIHRATSNDTPTTIGDDNFFMSNAHAGHDVIVGNNCTFSNATLLGGHAIIENHVIMGGNAGVHQFCRVGRRVMIAGMGAVTRDVLPFFMISGINIAGSLNVVGLRRSDMPREDIKAVRWVYKTINRRGKSLKSALEELKTRADNPIVREYLDFIESSKRGICTSRDDPKRRR